MFVLLMTIVVPKNWFKLSQMNWIFELKTPTKPFVLTRFNKWGG